MATQSIPHRRGGKHAVKDEDLTHTKYDGYNREQLLEAVKAAGCYRKDDKKSVMAKKLAEYDRNMQDIGRRALQERKEKDEKRQQEKIDALRASKARKKARQGRNDDKGQRRERGESVSSNSEDTTDVDEQDRLDAQKLTVTGGHALSDATWEDTCSDTTVRSRNPPIEPDRKLRLFEWSYVTMPPLEPPSQPRDESFPLELTYAPLKVITTHSRERIALPGLKYPAGVNPDYVPIPDSLTRSSARHGHMVSFLAHATIEHASTWAERTIVQGWNGRMFFSLPPRDDTKDLQLDAVYHKRNLEDSKLLRPRGGTMDLKTDRKHRFFQRLVNKRRKVAEVFEACKSRPLAVSYMPSYLDWGEGLHDISDAHEQRSLDNLFYIRFPHCDVPHYYFWAERSGWSDPTTPNPLWDPSFLEQLNNLETAPKVCIPPPQTHCRIKKSTTLPLLRPRSPTKSDFDSTLLSIEHELSTNGLSATLAKHRFLAMCVGTEEAWNMFTSKLPALYPSGHLPDRPPVQAIEGMCVAEKITALKFGQGFLLLEGDESWTRDDDAVWEVVTCTGTEAPVLLSPDMARDNEAGSNDSESPVQALYRRDSMDLILDQQNKRIYAWLEHISSVYSPLVAPLSPTLVDQEPMPEMLLPVPDRSNNGTPHTCPFCSSPWHAMRDFEKAEHMLSHSHTSPSRSTQAISLINAVGIGVKRRHSHLSISTLHAYSTIVKRTKRVKLLPCPNTSSFD